MYKEGQNLTSVNLVNQLGKDIDNVFILCSSSVRERGKLVLKCPAIKIFFIIFCVSKLFWEEYFIIMFIQKGHKLKHVKNN